MNDDRRVQFERSLARCRRRFLCRDAAVLTFDLLAVAAVFAILPLTARHFSWTLDDRAAVASAAALLVFPAILAFFLAFVIHRAADETARRLDRPHADEVCLSAVALGATHSPSPFHAQLFKTALDRAETASPPRPRPRFGVPAACVLAGLDILLFFLPRSVPADAVTVVSAAVEEAAIPDEADPRPDRKEGTPAQKDAAALEKRWESLRDRPAPATRPADAANPDLPIDALLSRDPEKMRAAAEAIAKAIREGRATAADIDRAARARMSADQGTDPKTADQLRDLDQAIRSAHARDAGSAKAIDGTAGTAAADIREKREVLLDLMRKNGREPPVLSPDSPREAARPGEAVSDFEAIHATPVSPMDRPLVDAYARRRWARSNAR